MDQRNDHARRDVSHRFQVQAMTNRRPPDQSLAKGPERLRHKNRRDQARERKGSQSIPLFNTRGYFSNRDR